MRCDRTIAMLAAGLMATMLLTACSTNAVESEAEAPTPDVDRAAQIAALGDCATDVAPDGPTINQLITAQEACEILGREDIFIAVAAG